LVFTSPSPNLPLPGTDPVSKDVANNFLAKDAPAPAVSDCSDGALGFGS